MNDFPQQTNNQGIYSPLIGGKELWNQLGFNTFAAFFKAHEKGSLGVRVFRIDGRRGWFAFRADIEKWHIALKATTHTQDARQ